MTLNKSPSAIFGERFPYPLDGKRVLLEIAEVFAAEFNQAARLYLSDRVSRDRALGWTDLTVTSAYPTTKQHCPRIVIVRTGSSPRLVGLGAEIETREVVLDDGTARFRVFKGQTVTDTLDIAICALNEQLRDDLYLWFQQYMLDAIGWALPQLPGVYDLRCTNAIDDQVEYQGATGQPGFEFYLARLSYQVQYDQVVLEDVDRLSAIVNWQSCLYANEEI
ncbi:hypothetical protein H6F43_03975 [Leptolyngbya sp. FACHB-36]|uniref:hypothetical protein n=1 Tax=Leptolyngbya sp. FACHB-36 TaxID=2692808 RepID=UPI001680E2BD|nr:hypothetical protein [Leptolyngbya sp. FACHB-36]MBD2019341.1 hypothetical protein [Leptolyngbya sp. FACHB-36]